MNGLSVGRLNFTDSNFKSGHFGILQHSSTSSAISKGGFVNVPRFPGLPEFFPDDMKRTFSCEFNNEVSQRSISNNRISSVSISRMQAQYE